MILRSAGPRLFLPLCVLLVAAGAAPGIAETVTARDAVEATDAALAGRTASFSYDRSGEIDRLAIDLEPAVSDIVFERVADE